MDNRSLIDETLGKEALTQYQKGEYNLALGFYITLELHQTNICKQPNISSDNVRQLASYQMMIGECHRELKSYPLGIESLQKAIKTLDNIEKNDDDYINLYDYYNSLGLAYFLNKEEYLAITAYQNSLEMINKVSSSTEKKLYSIMVNDNLLKVYLKLNENDQVTAVLEQLIFLKKQLGNNYPDNLSKPFYWQRLFEWQCQLKSQYIKIKSQNKYPAILIDIINTAQAWFNAVNYADTMQTQSFFNSLFVVSDDEEEYKKAISDFAQTFLDSLAMNKPVEKDDTYWLKIAIAYLLVTLRYTTNMTQDPNTMRKYIINGLRALSQLKSFRPREHESIYTA